MRLFTGQYDRTIDAKNRIQLPSQLRAAIEPERDGEGLYITLGEFKGTLSIYTERGFETVATRIETETMSDPDAVRFELQFYSTSVFVEMDKQGRFLWRFFDGEKSGDFAYSRGMFVRAVSGNGRVLLVSAIGIKQATHGTGLRNPSILALDTASGKLLWQRKGVFLS